MNTETMITELNAVSEKHKNDFVPTFQTNITAMCRDIIPKLKQLSEYETIGTVEEYREARERQRGKKPKHRGCYDKNGVWHEWNGINGKPYELCPNCEANLCCEMPYDKKPKYCDKCGQKLDWHE